MSIRTLTEIRFFKWQEDDTSVSLRSKSGSYGGGSECLVIENYQEVVGTISCGAHPGGFNGQDAYEGKAIVEYDIKGDEQMEENKHYIVRRLTPEECELLQGFPMGWTDIGDWVDDSGKKHKAADSPRYKALGNSIAIPAWLHIMNGVTQVLKEDGAVKPTLGSLFDGIGGFPRIWEHYNGKGSAVWASEVEPFCIAVTKERFKE